MKILIVGSGGREHALAWKVAQSDRLSQLFIAPGNAGTAKIGSNVAIESDNVDELVAFAAQQSVELVIVGPEAALAAGLVDQLQKAGIQAFGPTRAAAEIETSKAFSKQFMQRHQIPTAQFAVFNDFEQALAYLKQLEGPVVLKASGLAAGKGVILPETHAQAEAALRMLMIEQAFGSAGDEVIIEERLCGEEVSLLAFTDGITVSVMPPAQDHKRLQDKDQGPNTGGMGVYAPAPVCSPEMIQAAVKAVLQPAIDGLRQEGRPFVGVLYAGLILTEQGVKALEFNARFGDPETQVLLPLLENDLLEVIEACIQGSLGNKVIRWKSGAAASVVLASQGYPGKYPSGRVISGLEKANHQVIVFHAGTRVEDQNTVTAGGRVLNVTGFGPDLPVALQAAYRAIDGILFDGMQYRRDIGRRALTQVSEERSGTAYADAGVNIDAGNRAVALMRDAVRSTYTPAVLAGIGAFGGLFDAQALANMNHPVLVASTDGVGTKVRLAAAANRFHSIGADIVNHCVNDILVQGARPLFFLDYFASARLDPQQVAMVVAGIAEACREAGCALLGGETAEMPGVYASGEFDLAGTIIGVVEREAVLPRDTLCAGDLLVGLASSGPHTNGYSLIRKVFAGEALEAVAPELGISLADALLAPHRSYLPVLASALAHKPVLIKALAHLTGGGFIENIPRVVPEGLRVVIQRASWPVPPLFNLIQARGLIETAEMYRVFNMGIGMVAVIAPELLEAFQQCVVEPTWVIGSLESGEKGVELR
jgi:phosphoribosylamine--glycine ligase / phosphoribosylformylglycinamidine cyclo-ligase